MRVCVRVCVLGVVQAFFFLALLACESVWPAPLSSLTSLLLFQLFFWRSFVIISAFIFLTRLFL